MDSAANKEIKVISNDGYILKKGMTIWVNNIVLGRPPNKRVIGEIISHNKIKYDKPDKDGYIGCRVSIIWISEEKAKISALIKELKEEIGE